jgi:folate-dependent phosphoribosylglycinamide formyltransferase PurN
MQPGIEHFSIEQGSYSTMRIILVTNRDPHHLYWIDSIIEKFSESSVIFVTPESNKKSRYLKLIKEYGIIWFVLRIFSVIYNKYLNKSFIKELSSLEKKIKHSDRWKLSTNNFDNMICSSINSEEAISFINKKHPDVICFLGGDIAKKVFFESTNALVLNYHSGLSPFYNGSGTTFHSVAHHRPNFCGGTLMVMNERIDGGQILSYYLTPIEEKDTAATLFIKGIEGAVKLYLEFLIYYKNEKIYNSVNQERALHYFRANDWTLVEDLRVLNFQESGKMKLFVRNAKIINIYNSFDKNIQWIYSEMLNNILSKSIK